MELLKYLLFGMTYLYICNWGQVRMFFNSFFNPKETISIIKDKNILSMIKKKTGLDLKQIEIFNTDKLFGAMVGIPGKPRMVLSRGLYTTFNKDELEWVLLHESAHCLMWHTPKSAIVQASFLVLGLFLISVFPTLFSIWFIICVGLAMSLISIQIMKYLEYQADKYSIDRVDNPKGVITAQSKFEIDNPSWFYNEKNITRTLFYWNILPSQRIAMAKKKLG